MAGRGVQVDLAPVDQLAVPGKADRVGVIGRDPPRGVEAGGQALIGPRPIIVVADVVGPGPQQLHRNPGPMGDHRRLDHEIVHDPPAETAAAPAHVHGDGLQRQAERLGHRLSPVIGELGGGPDLETGGGRADGAVLRLQRQVRQERRLIDRLQSALGAGQRRLHVPLGALDLARGLQQLGGAAVIDLAVVGRAEAVVPDRVQGLARRVRLPPVAGDDGDPRRDPGGETDLGAGGGRDTLHGEHLLHPRHGPGGGEIGGGQLRPIDRRLHIDGVLHPRQDHVDAEDRLSRQDRRRVHADVGAAQDRIVLRVLQLQRLGVGQGLPGGVGGQLAIGQAAAGRGVRHPPVGGGEAGRVDLQPLRRRRHQHGPGGRAHPAHGLPVVGNRQAAAGVLRDEPLGVRRGEFHADVVPVHVQLLGDQHGQQGLGALAHVRVPGEEGHRSVGRQGDIVSQRRAGGGAGRGVGGDGETDHHRPGGRGAQGQEQLAAGQAHAGSPR